MIFISPQNHKELTLNKKSFVTSDGRERYSVIKGVPVLLPEMTNPYNGEKLRWIPFAEYDSAW